VDAFYSIRPTGCFVANLRKEPVRTAFWLSTKIKVPVILNVNLAWLEEYYVPH
jgi:hypothetical protein